MIFFHGRKKKYALVLDLLAGGPLYGLQLVEASGGVLRRGTVYITLSQMEREGKIASRKGSDGRRLYSLASWKSGV